MVLKRKKVLWLPKCYPNKFDVLDGVFTLEHAKAASIYNDVFVIFVHSDETQKERFNEFYSFSNNFHELKVYFRHREIGIKQIDQIIIGIKYFLTQHRTFRKIKKSWGMPELTHVHSLARTSFFALWLKWTNNIPFFITEHWSGFDPTSRYKINFVKRQFIKLFLSNANCITEIGRAHV